MTAEVKVFPKGSKPKEKAVDEKMSWRTQKRGLVINNEVSKFTKAFKDNSATLMISALGVVAALSWNDAIKSAIEALFPAGGDVLYKFYVAIMVTVISVVITYFFSRIKNNK